MEKGLRENLLGEPNIGKRKGQTNLGCVRFIM